MKNGSDKDGTKEQFPPYDSSEYQVKFSDMIRYLEAHFKSTACPQCSEDDGWSIDIEEEKPGGEEFLRVYRLAHAEDSKNFKTLFLMSCRACSSARQVMADSVVEWVKNNPAESK